MKKVGKLLVMLSLVAMAPSYAAKPSKPLAKQASAEAVVKKARPTAGVKKTHSVTNVKQSKIVDQSHLFKGLECPIVFVNSNYDGEPQNGEFCTPYTSLEQAAEAAPENAIIYVLAGEYHTDPYNYNYQDDIAVVTLKNGQKLIGSGCALRVGDVSIAALTDRHPVIFIGFGETGIVLANRNYVSGFQLVGEGIGELKDQALKKNKVKDSQAERFRQFGIRSASSLIIGIPIDTANTGLSSSTSKGSCHISKNSFVNLEVAIDVMMGPWSNIEICGNKFTSEIPSNSGILLGTRDGTSVSITKNFFEGVCRDITISHFGNQATVSVEKETQSTTYPINMESTDDESSICLGSEICIESNIFKDPLIGLVDCTYAEGEIVSYALNVTDGAKTVSFRHNKVCNFKSPCSPECPSNLSLIPLEINVAGIIIQLGLRDPRPIPGSFVDICHNQFECVDVNILGLGNTKTTVKENQFIKGFSGLGILSVGGVTAWVEKNRFCDNSCLGFGMEVGIIGATTRGFTDLRASATILNPTCLLLTENELECDGCTGTDYFLANLTNCPGLFKVAVNNPLNGRYSLSRDNDEGSVVIQDANGNRNDNAVDFVRHCPGCHDSK